MKKVVGTLTKLLQVKAEAVTQICSVKKGVLANFAEFSGKQLCQSCKLQLY